MLWGQPVGEVSSTSNNTPAPPKPIIARGFWKAKKLLNYTDGFGSYGTIVASILELSIDLMPVGGAVIKDATFELVCNIGPAGITTGEEEGFRLTIPGAPFGTFQPLVPALGLTHIGLTVNEVS